MHATAIKITQPTTNKRHLKYLKLLKGGVAVILNLLLHGREVHGLGDDGGVPGGNGICDWPCEHLLGILLLQLLQEVFQQLLKIRR